MSNGMIAPLCHGHEESRPGLVHWTLEEDERHVEQSLAAQMILAETNGPADM